MAEYIERETAIRAICDATAHTCNYRDCGKGCEYAQTLLLIPAEDVASVRHGRWNEESPDYLDGDSVYVCSVCGETWTLIEGTPLDNNMHYCPNCGAKMDGGET